MGYYVQHPYVLSRLVSNEKGQLQPLSRVTTRVAVESPRKLSHKTDGRTSHFGLTVPIVRATGSRLGKSKLVPFDPEDEYIFDSTDDEDEENVKPKTAQSPKPQNRGIIVYKKLCKKYGKIPIKNVWRQFGKDVISLKGFNLSQKELKAFFVALLEFYVNTDGSAQLGPDMCDELLHLILDGNKINKNRLEYVIDFTDTHRSLSNLSLVDCGLTFKSFKTLGEFLEKNRTIRKLDVSDNNFTDNAGETIANIIEFGENISYLALRGNKLAECGPMIGDALKANDTLRHLDLSWNHLRGNAAEGLCKGIQASIQNRINNGLETLLLAWNGFGFEGSAAMGKALADNTNLHTLDLSNNRIHTRDLFELIKGLEKNKTLTVLKIGHNPITSSMTSVLLAKLYQAKESGIQELDLTGVVVDKEFEGILRDIRQTRMMIVRYGTALPLNKDPIKYTEAKKMFNIDSVRILFYMKEHLRTIDLFLKVNRFGSQSLTRDEMKYAFEMEGFPISERALDKVIMYLERNKDGDVDFLELVNGELQLKKELIMEHEDKIMQENEHNKKYSKLFTAEKTPKILPPLTESREPSY
ncbi:hypothetical protein ACF0H5_010715 [Mactra antiquata]